MISPSGSSESPEHAHVASEPLCLRRRGPARLDLLLKRGSCPSMNRRCVHLRAGQTLVVKVMAQGLATKVEIIPEYPLQVIVPVSRVEGGVSATYHAEFSGRSPMKVPLPARGKLHVVILDGLANPCRITIPVAIWPAVGTLAMWWILAYLSIVGLRWQNSIAKSSSPWDIFPTVQSDLGYLLDLTLLGVLMVLALRIAGWFWVMFEPTGSGDG